MAKIEANEEKRFRVKAPMSEVYPIFADPNEMPELMGDLERHEVLADNKARWILEEKKEKGIKYQPDYTVVYDGNGEDEVSWRTIKGNMETSGTVKLRAISDDVTEIHYKEKLVPDLPIPRLMAKVFRPIVAREVRKGIGEYLERVEKKFGKA